TDEPDRIRAFLLTDRFFADYARGDLDPEHFQFTMWLGAEKDNELRTVVMTYHDLEPPIFCAIGEACGVEAILDRVLWLKQMSLSIREEHLPAVERFYRTELVPMLKMALESRPRVSPVTVESKIGHRNPVSVMKLDVSHLPLLEELYSHGGGDAFRQRSLELGVFYGIFAGERLISVAGTHIVSESERIAALGNVMTHPDYRGRGFATVATSAVCEELLGRGIEMIGLSVSRSNEAAIRVYEKIGFKRRVPFYEGLAVRRADDELVKE
ncbi:MAG TPA: GNAT family N-acetyltransferase, partial [Anaerolineae bacterium]|nr:GNAT family N-acetyltransferase [Anaerolineae bacterium]